MSFRSLRFARASGKISAGPGACPIADNNSASSLAELADAMTALHGSKDLCRPDYPGV